jgi:hypothetical protein
VSLTTDAVPSMGGSWTNLAPQSLLGSGGSIFTSVGDNIFSASGGGLATYQAVVPGSFAGVTAFRLEVFPETNGNNLLGASANGNFVLSQFRVDTGESFNWAALKQVTSSGPTWFREGTKNLANNIADDSLTTINHALDAGPSAFSYTVDLGGTIDLELLQLFARTDCCPNARMNDYRIRILDEALFPVWEGEMHTADPENGRIDSFTSASGLGNFEGRFVEITNIGSAQYAIQIAEVKAFGAVVPEPASGCLLMLSVGLLIRRRR